MITTYFTSKQMHPKVVYEYIHIKSGKLISWANMIKFLFFVYRKNDITTCSETVSTAIDIQHQQLDSKYNSRYNLFQ